MPETSEPRDTLEIELVVNSERVQRAVPVRRSLADFLRDDLRLTGTHLGCEHGVCGACTVTLDGAPVRACLVLAVQADGKRVGTVEGLAANGELSDMQQAFQRHHALQCGFCTPGFLVTLSVADPEEWPDDRAVRELLAGNLCRCTGYQQIHDAVLHAWGRTPRPSQHPSAGPAGDNLMAITDDGDRPPFVGARLTCREDAALIRARSRYVADVQLPGMVEAAFVRSPLAHAVVRRVDLDEVRALPGVLAAVAAPDLRDVERYPHFIEWLKDVRAFPLARDRVRYVGMPVAAVVAGDRYSAEDAAELVDVEYEELPVVNSIEAALADDAPRLYDDWPDNRVLDFPASDPEIDAIFATASVARETYRMQRQSPSPMETRGVLAEYQNGRLTVWSSSQSPHILRTTLAMMLGLREANIRVVVPSVGGGFGCKLHQYPEDIVVPWLAMRLGRPVRWIEDRREHMISAIHAREQVMDVAAAYDDRGRILAMRASFATDVGSAEVFIPGTATTLASGGSLTGPYKIPRAEVSMACVVTNKTPSGAYRGFGSPECVFARERMIEKVARSAGVDSKETRRAMFVQPEEHPYRTPLGGRLDSGSHRQTFDRAVELAEEALEKARRRCRDDADVRVGVGYAAFAEPTCPTYFPTTGFWSAHDSASVRLHPDGGATVAVGVTAIGQGTESTVAAVAADALGIPIEHVTVVTGDTDTCPYGLGAWGARGAIVATGAVLKAAEIIVAKARAIAAGMLEAGPEDVAIERGSFRVRGSAEPSVSMTDVANVAYGRTWQLPAGIDPGLEASVTYDPPGLDHVPGADGKMNAVASWSNACHAAIVKVDVTTGVTDILGYFVVHDCGTVINPVVVEGQIYGGVAQGIAGALYEHLVYDENGQPQSASFMDYAIPSALEIPPITIEHVETRAPDMPMGVKGTGESGAIGPAAAVANAVADALREFDVEIVSTPLTPESVLAAIQGIDVSAGIL